MAFVFTNVSSPLSWNFCEDTIPDSLRDAEHFLLDNPVARQKRFLVLKGDSNKKKTRMVMRKSVLACEEMALETAVKLFDWLDGLGSQPTTEIFYLYNMSQSIEAMIANTLAQMDQAARKKAEIDKLFRALKNNSRASFITSLPLGFQSNTRLNRIRILSATSKIPSRWPSGNSGGHPPSI